MVEKFLRGIKSEGEVMIKAKYRVENPDKIVMTAEISMTMNEWCELREQLENKWPATQLSSVISEMITDARKVFYATEIDPELQGEKK